MIFEIHMIFLEINTFFDQSTLPKFIKRAICRSRIRRLIKSLKKMKILESYTWSDIYILLNFVEADDTNQDKSYFSFNIVNENNDLDQIEISFDPDREAMDLTFTIKYNGNSVRSMLLALKDTDISHSTTDMSKRALDDINDIIRVYIDRFADDIHERSERIYKS